MDLPLFFGLLRRLQWNGLDRTWELDDWLRDSPILTVRWIERALREPRHHALRVGIALQVAELPERVGVLGVASCQRDGFQRQAALQRLDALPGRWALGFLCNRLNDPVPAIRELAQTCVRRRLEGAPAADLVACLPLLDGSAGLRRVQSVVWVRLLGQRDLDAALEAALVGGDPEVRMSALGWRLRHGPPVAAATLRTLLRDPEPSVRAEALQCILAAPERETLLPMLLEDPDPRARLAGLRLLSRAPDRLREHVFDRAANNRFHVRTWLQQAGVVLNYRTLALEALAGESKHLLGALGLLAETGLAEDRVQVAALLTHPTARVRREARRTLGFLDAYVG